MHDLLIGDFAFNSQRDSNRLLAEARGTKHNTVERRGNKCLHHGKNASICICALEKCMSFCLSSVIWASNAVDWIEESYDAITK